MKNFILILLILPNLAFAQFTKGQVFLGGTISGLLQNSNRPVTSGSNNVPQNNSLSFSPSIGFFLNDKVALGAALGYSSSYYEYDYQNFNGTSLVNAYQKTSSDSYGLGSFIRYYIPISNSFYFALQGQLSFSRSNLKLVTNYGTGETIQKTPYYSLSAGVKPVLIFFPSPKWGIEASIGLLGYTRTQYLPDVYSANALGLSAGSFGLGLSYYFGK